MDLELEMEVLYDSKKNRKPTDPNESSNQPVEHAWYHGWILRFLGESSFDR
jgi:hypothetical protein